MRYGLSAEERIERFDLQGGAISESSRPRREVEIRESAAAPFGRICRLCRGFDPAVSAFESGRVEEFGNEGASFHQRREIEGDGRDGSGGHAQAKSSGRLKGGAETSAPAGLVSRPVSTRMEREHARVSMDRAVDPGRFVSGLFMRRLRSQYSCGIWKTGKSGAEEARIASSLRSEGSGNKPSIMLRVTAWPGTARTMPARSCAPGMRG
jgi:hypothetical protein